MTKKGCLSLLAFIGVAIVGVVGLAGLYVWNPVAPWQDEITVYRAECSDVSRSGIVCFSGFVAGERQVFRVQPEPAEVATWIEDGDAREIGRYRNCAIRDLENWRCPAQGDLAALSMNAGNLRLTVPDMLVHPQVYRWQWQLLDFGVGEYSFYKWTRFSPFAKWIGFPSAYDAIVAIREFAEQRQAEKTQR